MKLAVLFTASLIALASQAIAQSSLGFSGAKLSVIHDDGANAGASGTLALDFAITDFHGVQLELGLEETGAGTIGTSGGHLYVTPADGQKYGLFAVVGDADDRSATYGLLGAEGLFSMNPRTVLELRGGIGVASHSSLDFLFVEADLHHDLSSDVSFHGGLTLAEFDELGLSATGYELRAGVTYKPAGQPWGGVIEVARNGLHGFAGDTPGTSLRVGMTFELGNTRRAGPETRLFRTPDPVRPLMRQGLF